MDEGTFLTEKEVAELTGIKTGRNERGVTIRREQLQVAQLRLMGIPFHENARGRPMIFRAVALGLVPASAAKPKAWSPRAIR
ncbi:DUF4224 domain-containing protein [Pseudomonas sp. S 311-6]|uniref:DUF4224 domain-containing protein n=1 Tax=Kerstersia gyiorum TaxID=206506 RepID=UPI001070DF0C|nr:DUF4224 domain-containing protein [Kerstersia gyiorum]MCO7641923.1 DUF4224 domain-containing protein [Pseudomonas sp. S 311-6]QBR40996.1 DUF4224 domain-containing protein [Kerstersia gyiorum]